jgi:CheY-like chemotaxis protein
MVTARLLVVEDERIVAAELCRRLTRLGYTVVGTAASGEEAIAKAQTHRPDLVLMDIGLKGTMNGVEAAEAIRTTWQIPVIFVTAYMPEGPNSEGGLYIRKPFDEHDLRTTIAQALGASRPDHT